MCVLQSLPRSHHRIDISWRAAAFSLRLGRASRLTGHSSAAAHPPLVASTFPPAMRFSRHVANEMRLYRVSRDDVEATMTSPAARALDERGNNRLAGKTSDGRPILVVVAGDDPDLVITVFLRS